MQTKEDKVRNTLEGLVRLFESGDAPVAIARSTLPRPDIPASGWSLCNNLLLWIAGTGDARGYRQWEIVGRHVRKGARAIHILAPTFRKAESNKSMPSGNMSPPPDGTQNRQVGQTGGSTSGNIRQDSNKTERLILQGFRAVPVFRFEETDGRPLQYDLEPPAPPPLIDVAKAWNLEIRYVGCAGAYLGYYRHNVDRPHEITLATHDQQVFFHELAHAAQYRVWEDIKPNQKVRKEVAAELAACALMRLYGTSSLNEGASFQYIKAYCDHNGKSLSKTLWGLVSDTEQIITAILAAKNHCQPA